MVYYYTQYFISGLVWRRSHEEEEEEEEEEEGRSCRGTYVSQCEMRKHLDLEQTTTVQSHNQRVMEEFKNIPPKSILYSLPLLVTGKFYLLLNFRADACHRALEVIKMSSEGLPLEQRPQAPHHLLLSGVTGERRGKRRGGGEEEEGRQGEDVLQREANGGDGERQAR
ncbi:Voltage-dependent L-type calcium channel subunit alpha-1C [Dissostichus eleginoides]|uniref:Voltage-dependent L-type calcium channel subunit alpha-1C n=1 Tax=Dissostichus eleginoides TaxID=100907 RepID=A0AAD9F955_DISEL|nr:Voltage-dependent L-type calcium channel subunit alpha-1C [Dissostichus eleginoides]